MDTLTRLITLYPTAHRAPSAALSAFSLRHMNGSSSTPSNTKLLDTISRLYSVLHLTGGKVGAVNLWRKSMEETLSFGHESLFSLRSTFPDEGMLYIYKILLILKNFQVKPLDIQLTTNPKSMFHSIWIDCYVLSLSSVIS